MANIINIHNSQRVLYLFNRDQNGVQTIETVKDFYPYCFVRDEQGEAVSFKGEKLKKMLYSDPMEMKKNNGPDAFESDIFLPQRYLIDKVDKLDKTVIKWAAIDVEMKCTALPDAENPKFAISCISVFNSVYGTIQTFFLPEFEDEETMLLTFVKYLKDESFDLHLGWNYTAFDFPYLSARWGRLFGKRGQSFGAAISPVGLDRWGKDGVMYPIGTSIVDYLEWFKKITLNKEERYTLDHIAHKHLGIGKTFDNVDFSKVNEEVKYRNQEDVQIIANLEDKFKIIDFHDALRRLSKVDFESMTYYSRIVDVLLLQEAHDRGVILPNKPNINEDEEFESIQGAYRDAFETGRFEGITEYDLSSAYPWSIINFCLDPANVVKEGTPNSIKIENTYFEQKDGQLLPTVVKMLVDLKGEVKAKLEKCQLGTEAYKENEIMYAAVKSVTNASYGVMAMRFFRLYDPAVAGGTTWLVRNLLHYVQDALIKKAFRVIYIDTDGIMINSANNLMILINQLVQEWGDTFGKKNVNIKFEYNGIFEKLLILKKCRYVGYIKTEKGVKKVIKGVEQKRKDSSTFMKLFQEELIEKILNNEPKEKIVEWIKEQRIKLTESPLEQISFPAKVNKPREVYKNLPIFLRALDNTPQLQKQRGDSFFYIYLTGKDASKKQNVLAFDENNQNHIERSCVDFKKMSERNIDTKVAVIFVAMKWVEDLKSLNIKPPKEEKEDE